MSRKLEIRTRMSELQKEFSSLNEEMKGLEQEAKTALAREKYKEYKFKVGTYSYVIEPEDKVQDATDDDKAAATTGKSGLVYTGFSESSGYGYVLLKERADYSRAARVLQIIDAVEHLADDKVKDKEPHIRVILGEEVK